MKYDCLSAMQKGKENTSTTFYILHKRIPRGRLNPLGKLLSAMNPCLLAGAVFCYYASK